MLPYFHRNVQLPAKDVAGASDDFVAWKFRTAVKDKRVVLIHFPPFKFFYRRCFTVILSHFPERS